MNNKGGKNTATDLLCSHTDQQHGHPTARRKHPDVLKCKDLHLLLTRFSPFACYLGVSWLIVKSPRLLCALALPSPCKETNERHIMRPAGTITLSGPGQALESPSITLDTETFLTKCVIFSENRSAFINNIPL